MASLAWISVFLILQGGHSYILLTANLDDVHAIAKQIADSPVVGQLTTILRRASNIFSQQLSAGNDARNKHRSLRRQLQSSDSSFEPQDNRIEGRNRPDQAPRHHRRHHTDDDQHHRSYRRFADSQNSTKSYNADETSDDHKMHESQEKDKSSQEEREPSRDKLKEHKDEAQRKEKEPEKSEEEDTDDIKIERHEKRDRSSKSHTDEVVALGKNASFYLNSIKKMMETV